MKVITAIGENAVIAPAPTINKVGSIFLPPNMKEQRLNMGGRLATRFKPVWGTVISVGEGKKTAHGIVPPEVKPGDRVCYGQRGADAFMVGGVVYHRVLQEMILAILIEDEMCDAPVADQPTD